MRRTSHFLSRCAAPLRMIVPRVVHLSMLFFSFFLDKLEQGRQLWACGVATPGRKLDNV